MSGMFPIGSFMCLNPGSTAEMLLSEVISKTEWTWRNMCALGELCSLVKHGMIQPSVAPDATSSLCYILLYDPILSGENTNLCSVR